MTKRKPDFKKNNPGMVAKNFISAAETPVRDLKGEEEKRKELEAKIKQLKAQNKKLEREKETKSKHVNLLMRPSEVKEYKAEAKEQKVSFNQFVEKSLEVYAVICAKARIENTEPSEIINKIIKGDSE